jgi:hypothetical protein
MRLASGLEIPNRESLFSDYCDKWHRNWSQSYDGNPVLQNNELSQDDIWLSRQLVSRLTYRQRDAILEKREEIGEQIRKIPPGVDLLDIPEGGQIPGQQALSQIITIMCAIEGVKLPKTMKILHKKRPALIPVIDRVIESHYWPRCVPSVCGRSQGDYTIALIRAFHRDMHSVARVLRAMADETTARGRPLTPCRILDILIWSVKKSDGAIRATRTLGSQGRIASEQSD